LVLCRYIARKAILLETLFQGTLMAEPVTVFTPPKSPAVNPAPAVVERNTAPVRDARAVTGDLIRLPKLLGASA
jgi:hypothetical protein